MSKAILVTEMPKKCSKCPYCDGDGWCYLQEQYIEVEKNKERDFCCPLKPYSEFVPIEWMKHWAMKNWAKSKKCEYDIIVSKMIEQWEKENGLL